MCAPIIIFPYNRPSHFLKTIEALRQNTIAKLSDLYVYSDGPKDEVAVPLVATVRGICKDIDGFRSVTVVERGKNLGPCESFRLGISETLSHHGSAIIFDDDTICSPNTLVYFNACLERYRDMASVFSITGWCPPPSLFQIPKNYPYDVFFMPRNGSWGWAIWKDRWDKIDWNIRDYASFAREAFLINAFSECGDDLLNMLKSQVEGAINTWDIQICYAQFKHRAVTVYPVKSYTANIGLDGSGTHFSGNCAKFSSKLDKPSNLLRLPDHIFVNSQVQSEFRKVYDKPKLGIRILNRVSRILFNQNLFNH